MFPPTTYTLSQELQDALPSSSSQALSAHTTWDARATQPIVGKQADFWPVGQSPLNASPLDASPCAAGPSYDPMILPPYQQHPPAVPTEYGDIPTYDLAPPLPPSPPTTICAKCQQSYDPEANHESACFRPHTAVPILAYIRGGKAMYPVLYHPCCSGYQLALGAQGVSGCYVAPHYPAAFPSAGPSFSLPNSHSPALAFTPADPVGWTAPAVADPSQANFQ